MTLHRVKSHTIPLSELKPDPHNHGPKELRWFHHETQRDYELTVRDERDDGTFILVATIVCPQLNVPAGEVGKVSIVEKSLDQATVDKSERAGPRLTGRGFVIFEDSPKTRELWGADHAG